MRAVLFLCLAILLIAPKMSFAWEMRYSGKTLVVYVRQIEPGNVLLVNENRNGGDNDLVVRFYGIGIPTSNQPFGVAAAEELRKLLPPGKKIIITTVKEDEEGIISALVQMDDHSINNMLVDRGLAWVDRSTCKAFFCRRWHIQEHLALKNHRGIWSANISTPPWQWGE